MEPGGQSPALAPAATPQDSPRRSLPDGARFPRIVPRDSSEKGQQKRRETVKSPSPRRGKRRAPKGAPVEESVPVASEFGDGVTTSTVYAQVAANLSLLRLRLCDTLELPVGPEDRDTLLRHVREPLRHQLVFSDEALAGMAAERPCPSAESYVLGAPPLQLAPPGATVEERVDECFRDFNDDMRRRWQFRKPPTPRDPEQAEVELQGRLEEERRLRAHDRDMHRRVNEALMQQVRDLQEEQTGLRQTAAELRAQNSVIEGQRRAVQETANRQLQAFLREVCILKEQLYRSYRDKGYVGRAVDLVEIHAEDSEGNPIATSMGELLDFRRACLASTERASEAERRLEELETKMHRGYEMYEKRTKQIIELERARESDAQVTARLRDELRDGLAKIADLEAQRAKISEEYETKQQEWAEEKQALEERFAALATAYNEPVTLAEVDKTSAAADVNERRESEVDQDSRNPDSRESGSSRREGASQASEAAPLDLLPQNELVSETDVAAARRLAGEGGGGAPPAEAEDYGMVDQAESEQSTPDGAAPVPVPEHIGPGGVVKKIPVAAAVAAPAAAAGGLRPPQGGDDASSAGMSSEAFTAFTMATGVPAPRGAGAGDGERRGEEGEGAAGAAPLPSAEGAERTASRIGPGLGGPPDYDSVPSPSAWTAHSPQRGVSVGTQTGEGVTRIPKMEDVVSPGLLQKLRAKRGSPGQRVRTLAADFSKLLSGGVRDERDGSFAPGTRGPAAPAPAAAGAEGAEAAADPFASPDEAGPAAAAEAAGAEVSSADEESPTPAAAAREAHLQEALQSALQRLAERDEELEGLRVWVDKGQLLSSNLAEARAVIGDMEGELATLETRNRELESANIELMQRTVSTAAQLSDKLAESLTQVRTLTRKVEVLEDCFVHHKKKIRQLKVREGLEEYKRNVQTRERERYDKEVAQVRAELAHDLERNLQIAEAAQRKMRRTQEHFRMLLADVRSQSRGLSNALREAKAEIENLKEIRDNLTSDYAELRNELFAEIRRSSRAQSQSGPPLLSPSAEGAEGAAAGGALFARDPSAGPSGASPAAGGARRPSRRQSLWWEADKDTNAAGAAVSPRSAVGSPRSNRSNLSYAPMVGPSKTDAVLASSVQRPPMPPDLTIRHGRAQVVCGTFLLHKELLGFYHFLRKVLAKAIELDNSWASLYVDPSTLPQLPSADDDTPVDILSMGEVLRARRDAELRIRRQMHELSLMSWTKIGLFADIEGRLSSLQYFIRHVVTCVNTNTLHISESLAKDLETWEGHPKGGRVPTETALSPAHKPAPGQEPGAKHPKLAELAKTKTRHHPSDEEIEKMRPAGGSPCPGSSPSPPAPSPTSSPRPAAPQDTPQRPLHVTPAAPSSQGSDPDLEPLRRVMTLPAGPLAARRRRRSFGSPPERRKWDSSKRRPTLADVGAMPRAGPRPSVRPRSVTHLPPVESTDPHWQTLPDEDPRRPDASLAPLRGQHSQFRNYRGIAIAGQRPHSEGPPVGGPLPWQQAKQRRQQQQQAGAEGGGGVLCGAATTPSAAGSPHGAPRQ
eukprot:TRINITY_DN13702_c0_g3_i1.p1 TRINITY_DN13702_c0_g3~~TRINITY_DN13702_c0_g3_i1.p1  ORF type:complete len:1568 (+),score=598.97 TRINITY_DN13702_c0_g3_i1:67-4704(+)